MSISVGADRDISALSSYRRTFSALHSLPDHCALNVSELAARIGADKLDLIKWAREDIGFARLVASKVAP
jgi:hypothetical protein